MVRPLAECLVEEGLLGAAEIERGLEAQRRSGGSLGAHLVALGLLDEDSLARALSRAYAVPFVTRRELLSTPPEVLALLSPEFARRHRALPFRVEGNRLAVALQNPANQSAITEAAFLTGFAVTPYVGAETAIRAAIELHHRVPELVLDVMSADEPTSPIAPEAAAAADPVRTAPQAPPAPAAVAPAAPAPAPPAGAPRSLAERFADVGTRAEAVTLAVEELAAMLPRAVVFAVRSTDIAALDARGILLPRGGVSIPVGTPGVLAPALEHRLQFGPVPLDAAAEAFYTRLGVRPPVSALVVPVLVRNRAVLVLYADDPAGRAARPDFDRVKRLASLVACALEISIIRAKMLRDRA